MKSVTSALAVLTLSVAAATAALAAAPASFTAKVTGAGRPMILIPGLASPGEVWDATVAHFRDRFECHTVSLAGFGGTAPVALPDGTPWLATVRDELATYVRERGLTKPVVVGHSLGGFLALDLAAKHPELPGELVIVDGLPFFAGIMRPDATVVEARRMGEGMAAQFAGLDGNAYAQMIRGGPNGSTMATREADLERIIGWGLASDPATVGRSMSEMYGIDLRTELGQVRARTLVVAAWVGYAPYASRASVEQVYRSQFEALSGCGFAISDTARHFIMLDEPEWLWAQVAKFLAARES